jgi:hypothetical protein
LYHLAVCANLCTSGVTSDGSSTCGRVCDTNPIGAFGTPSGTVGSTGTCNTNSTFCPGGTYTITRNTYSTVNFDCNGCCGCGSFGCCTGIGPPSSPGVYCITCNY